VTRQREKMNHERWERVKREREFRFVRESSFAVRWRCDPNSEGNNAAGVPLSTRENQSAILRGVTGCSTILNHAAAASSSPVPSGKLVSPTTRHEPKRTKDTMSGYSRAPRGERERERERERARERARKR